MTTLMNEDFVFSSDQQSLFSIVDGADMCSDELHQARATNGNLVSSCCLYEQLLKLGSAFLTLGSCTVFKPQNIRPLKRYCQCSDHLKIRSHKARPGSLCLSYPLFDHLERSVFMIRTVW